MYSYIKGTLEEISEDQIVVENQESGIISGFQPECWTYFRPEGKRLKSILICM